MRRDRAVPALRYLDFLKEGLAEEEEVGGETGVSGHEDRVGASAGKDAAGGACPD